MVHPIIDPAYVLGQMSIEEKIALLSGDDMWHTVPVPRLGVPRVRCSDGPNGVRGIAWTNGAAASCFPCATGLGASFDVEFLQRVGKALGEECRARGVHCLLGPTTNIQRHPCGGRGFESYSEDPFLSGMMALAWIHGVQSCKVMTSPKHFVGNEQEHLRRSNDSVIDERTLHEIYLEPFRLQAQANPAVFMTSYNRVNGLHAAEHPRLLREILRRDFGFKGMVISDWSGTYSSSEAIKASLDLEMPGPSIMRGPCLERDIIGGKLTPADIDECVLRVLQYVRQAQLSGIPFDAEESSIDTPRIRSLLREAAASGIVLLKNDAHVLPLKPTPGMKIAVIGPNARSTCYSGGGSASLAPTYLVSPLDAITAVAEESSARVQYSVGADNNRWTPLLTPFIQYPDEQYGKGPGVVCEFFDTNPWETPGTEPLFTKTNNSAFSYFIDGIPKHVPVRGYVSLKTRFKPDVTGVWLLGLGVAGQADLYVDGRKIVDNSTDQQAGLLFFNTGAEERVGEIQVVAGQSYLIEVRFSNKKQLNAMSPYSGRRGGIRIGGRPKYDVSGEIEKAVALSKTSDATILVIGTNSEWESEAYDRDDIQLPSGTDELVRAVLAATPDTIIVNQSGMPVEFPWLSSASTVLQAFFGGNDVGNGIADVIFGKVNPSGKLPITWGKKLDDWPSHGNFGDDVTTVYKEGISVGYRFFDRGENPKSDFAFGHGLSYTTFGISDLQIFPDGTYGARAEVTVKNTGGVAGAEVPQLYIHDLHSSVPKPEVELVGFEKVYLAPGEAKQVSLSIAPKAFSFYDETRKAWVAHKGEYEFRVGPSSVKVADRKVFNLEESFTWIGQQDPKPLRREGVIDG